MARSRRHTPGFCDKTKGMKKFANKTVRHTKDVPNGMAYKKLFCSYDICDWKFLYFSKREVEEVANKYYDGRKHMFYIK